MWERVTVADKLALARRYRLRGLLMALAGLPLLVGFLVGAVLLENRSADLAANGVPAPAVVVEAHPGARGLPGSVAVRFAVNGVERTRSLSLDDDSQPLRAGDRITVFHDRADPDRIAAPGASNDPPLATILMIAALLLGGFLFLFGLFDVLRWTRRARAARQRG
ncbi:DUF3592 domain-containing protein [Crossiella cryophila]|uniref:DUF3592 domain-containing protein n=1 Tax=Crossiella cryophila TaxID=43355 RepID=A0A7W7FVM2_9PSEU|nr:DUF3592 domain-containing protein [Crossiella cryophila]MBB4678623.1 hypothetical protein [Crossiella cryophila]